MAGSSDIGKIRKENQDSYHLDESVGLAVLCDGIGGRQGGKRASHLACEIVHRELSSKKKDEPEDSFISSFLVDAITKANDILLNEGQKNPHLEGMGTTLECLYFTAENLYIGHIGDSRTYLYQDEKINQLTIDHSVISLVSHGLLTPEALTPHNSNSLVRAVGLSTDCEADVYTHPIKSGDLFLIASDGLFNMVGDEEIASILALNDQQQAPSLQELAQTLVKAANERGGRDNITVIICLVE